jgi:DNA ligase-1
VTRFSDVVATSATVGATGSRRDKVAALAALLAELDPDEVPIVVAVLEGLPRQGRFGLGWATLADLRGTTASPQLEVGELDARLDELAACGGPGSRARRAALLDELSARLTEPEAEFLRALLTGELRQGALTGLVAEAVASAAAVPTTLVRRAAMLSGDLAGTARLALADGAGALRTVGLRVGTPIQPMLASTAVDVEEAVTTTGAASVEWKLDGVRIQAHRAGDAVRLYTRNLNDVTDRMPGLVDELLALPVRAVVLDGEALGVTEEGIPHAFQDSAGSFGRRATPGPVRLDASWFDVLHLDGRDLVDEPLAVRRDALESVAGLRRVPSQQTDDPAVAAAVLDDALATGHEGIMVKSLASPYEAGRRGKQWRKIKPVHTLDLVVLGVEWGSGRRRGWLSNLHLGALGPDGVPVMVGKTFKGLTDELLAWQTARFLELETHREGHVVHVRPEQVVEIALDGAQVSTRYPGGLALRFARVRRYRDDKQASDADTLDAVRALLPASRR